MNAVHPQSPKRRSIPPLAWAGGGTLLLHGVFLLTLCLWPKSPEKPRETLLEVDLRQDKKPQIVAPPKPKPEPTPKRKLVEKPRLARVEAPKPRPRIAFATPRKKLVPVVTPKPIPTTPQKVEVVPTPIPPKPKLVIKPKPVEPKVKPRRLLARSTDIETPHPTRQPDQTIPKSPVKTHDNETAAAPVSPKPNNSPRRSRRVRNTNSTGGSPASLPSNSAGNETPAPSGSQSGRRFARAEEPESSTGRANSPTDSTSGSSAAGFIPRRQTDDAVGGEPDITLPRTRARRGRSGSLETPVSSAPTSSADGTELNIGPSRPTSSGGGSRRASFDTGEGTDTTGSPIRRGLTNAGGGGSNGSAYTGRGTDVAGSGAGNGTASRGNGTGRGRGRSRLAGDPFSNGGDGKGRGTSGNGPGSGDSGNGIGNGPKGGIRLAKRNLGGGNSDGDGGGGVGRGLGPNFGNGQGGRGSTGNADGGGRGYENADGVGSGHNRAVRGRGGRRETEGEDQIGRGIWGGFKIRYYQDKADHPDMPDGTFYPGNPIDWPVFTQLMAQKTSPNLDFDWGTTPPTAGMRYTFWSMKAAGRIFVPKDDTYEFFFDELDDAGSLTLDGKSIIKIWQVQKSSPSSGKMFLKRGPHDIQIEYIQGPATAASIKLSWRSTSFPKEIVGVYQASEN